MAKYSEELKTSARLLYLKGATPKEIKKKLNLPNTRIIYYWAENYCWRDLLSLDTVGELITRRIALLTDRDKKTELEIKELDMLIEKHVRLESQKNKHTEKLAAIQSAPASNNGVTYSPDGKPQPKKSKRKNDISGLTADSFKPFLNTLFDYQLHLRENKHHKVRNLLKSRQIGATYYFAFEAFEDAVLTGEPQIFISASRVQAEVFRTYIVHIAMVEFGIELKGNPITLSNGAVLRFLSTNSNTTQSHSGHLYIDEYFWIQKFTKLNEVASAMAMQSRWRITYFSTPSAKDHPAYPFWTGEEWKRNSKERQEIEFPKDHELRDGGRLCPDDQWRYIVTLEDAIAGGFNLADIDKLRNRYSVDAFNMLFMCVFIDDGDSVFKFSLLEKCAIDSGRWQDFDPQADRPFGNREVWGGYDPSRTTDNATFVVIAPPIVKGEKFRVLAIYKWQGVNFKYQADQIKAIKAKYNMTYIGVDITGIGRGVFELIQNFALREAVAIHYSLESKTRLVLKMIDVIEGQRIEWDQGEKDLPASFLSIKRTTTGSGSNVTFVASRSGETGHADDFFAISHAVIHEPLNYENKRSSTWVI